MDTQIKPQEIKEKRPFYRKIPGFRSGKWWKMGIAVLFYTIILSTLFVNKSGAPDAPLPTVPATPPTTTAPATRPAPEPRKEPLELLDIEWWKEPFARYIVGNIRNNSNRTYSYVQVEINLFDKNNVQVGSTLANVNNLAPGITWRFKAIVLQSEAETAKVANITGF